MIGTNDIVDDAFEGMFDGEAPIGLNLPVSPEQAGFIEKLLSSSVFDQEGRTDIESRINQLSYDDATKLIWYLKENQLNPTQGNMGSQKQISKHIKGFC